MVSNMPGRMPVGTARDFNVSGPYQNLNPGLILLELQLLLWFGSDNKPLAQHVIWLIRVIMTVWPA